MASIVYAALGPSGTLGTVAPNFWSYVDFYANPASSADALAANPATAHAAETGITFYKNANMGTDIGSYISNAAVTDGHRVFPGINLLTVQVGTAVSTDQDLADLRTFCSARRAAGWYVVPLTAGPHADASYNINRNYINPFVRAMVGAYCDAVLDVDTNPTIGPDTAGFNGTYYPDGQHPSQLTDSIRAEILRPIFNARITAGNDRRLVKIGS